MVTLKEARLSHDISQEELAQQAGVLRKTVSRAENGKPILKETLAAICAVLGISPNEVEGVDATSRVGLAARRKPRNS